MSTKKIHLNIKSSIFHSRKLESAQYLPTYTDTNKQIILMQEVFWARKWNWTLPCSYVDEVEEHHKVHIFQIFKQQQNENHLEWLPGPEPAGCIRESSRAVCQTSQSCSRKVSSVKVTMLLDNQKENHTHMYMCTHKHSHPYT